ncbi:MAG: class I SAM-dependent methyltransferase [Betaproteobacteria bacterium]|nr:class I SAM-dependent methyltransferase [Betaproteobacteria bacterium]
MIQSQTFWQGDPTPEATVLPSAGDSRGKRRACRRSTIRSLAAGIAASALAAQKAWAQAVQSDAVSLSDQEYDVPFVGLIDLGCGDGRIVRTAARRYRVQGLGVDLDPALVGQAQALAREEGVGALCRFEVRDLYDTDLSQADVLTLYLLPAVNLALRPRLQALKPGTRILSHDWDLGDWSAQEIRWIDAPDKAVGFEKRSKILKWIIP